ncbi:bifunctional riboflavin kinase/FAD synthetase [Umezakia ovalisporum]|uniref:Riboflavin biosynthesis protein n=3 Tax=Umezakia ovalisporum TaxID=75695 RepID=A0AA43H1H5_9CYAN|nr:bifunctional riboflavin kinase/FAD synthetase [Umezakia ovalisporum]MDH6055652.1 bifunctional riboflavin kinase/FAD synthetase [Umezakia ovalisporum FSS-43]MDH6065408.1 bifunctional riboflavin kinase/FAD synthetase [Umezakia ovalisporum FSS-62]MDH6066726.1 bifunctional riboflavin kinase/FAD synthetase [Umezakia ovalisporum APH033B]MDH6070860.1 bifunctional riboflavin kinase/FAD synthetase [Umezakia ovalisporum CobakiLakeA]MDH6075181.1 bifunctional riboflavin kinase/FAD synthetase [Umezakia 
MLNLSKNGRSMWVASSTELTLKPTAVALGKFDGVHLGHHRVIQPILPQVLNEARREDGEQSPTYSPTSPTQLQEHTYSTVVTFVPHPLEFFTGQLRPLLTPLDEKVQQLRSLGVEQLVLLPFDRELSALSPQDFVDKILVQQLQCRKISVGQDFCFGKQRRGTAKDLQLLAAKHHIPVTIVCLQTHTENVPSQEAPISTSLIRHYLESGDIKNANLLLGRPYTLIGTVVPGKKMGRTIGFPTANLQLPKDKFIPRQGVYAVRAAILSETSGATSSHQNLGVMNIGKRPTVNGSNLSVEVHLFDWCSDLYGRKLAVQLVAFLRGEQKFASLEHLKTQIQIDCNIARKLFE